MRDLASLYNLSASAEWQALLTHFELGEGFAFIVLMVPNDEGAEVCRAALDRHLKESGKRVREITVAAPADLRNLAETLLRIQTGSGRWGCLGGASRTGRSPGLRGMARSVAHR